MFLRGYYTDILRTFGVALRVALKSGTNVHCSITVDSQTTHLELENVIECILTVDVHTTS